jgi:DNA-binding transcriptional regulator GbsR (MarR family)
MESREIDHFIESWGSMGVLWGINRSMARIHALMIVSEEPLDLDFVAKRLNISRGNASMCLKELRNWGVIQRLYASGDRRDFYVVEPDVWKMFFRIAVERKKREFDPALHSLQHLLSETQIDTDGKAGQRLVQMEEFLSLINRFMNKSLENETAVKTVMGVLNKFIGDTKTPE